MEAMQVHEMYEAIKEAIGAEAFLDALYRAMDTDEAYENFEFIARMNDIDL